MYTQNAPPMITAQASTSSPARSKCRLPRLSEAPFHSAGRGVHVGAEQHLRHPVDEERQREGEEEGDDDAVHPLRPVLARCAAPPGRRRRRRRPPRSSVRTMADRQRQPLDPVQVVHAERADHGEVADGEVEDVGDPVPDRDADGEHRVDRAGGDAGDEQVAELHHAAPATLSPATPLRTSTRRLHRVSARLRRLLDDDQRRALLVDLRQRVVHPLGDGLGQPQAGLVDREDLRVGGQPARDRDHLLLPAGEGAGRAA